MSAVPPRPTLYVIDVSGFVFRAFYSLPPLTRADGAPVGAVFGFCNMILKLRETICARSVDGQDDGGGGGGGSGGSNNDILWACAFDISRRNFRHTIDENYKANRKDTPPDLVAQFPLIRDAVMAFNCSIFEKEDFEADDIIASCCKTAKNQNIDVVIVSSDKDLMQLYDDHVNIFDPMKNKWITRDDIIAKFGVPPEQVTDVQALAGDASDGIQGVPGIGVKTAAELIRKYGSLGVLLNNLQTIPQKKRKEALEQYSDAARTAKALVTLRDDIAMDFDLDRMKFPKIIPEKTLAAMSTFFGQHGFLGLQKRIGIIKENTSAHTPKETSFFIVDSSEKLNKAAEDFSILHNQTINAHLVVKNNDDAISHVLVQPSCTNDASDVSDASNSGGPVYIFVLSDSITQAALRAILAPIFMRNHIVAYGIKPIFHFLQCILESFDDLQLLAYLLIGNGSIDDTVRKYSFVKTCDAISSVDEKATQAIQNLLSFGELCSNMKNEIEGNTALARIYQTLDLPVVSVIYEMERSGVFFDSEKIQKFAQELDQSISAIESDIYKFTGRDFNIASSQQLGIVLFEVLNIPYPQKSKTGQYKTDSKTLAEILTKGEYLVIELILRWRTLFKLRSSYTNTLLNSINAETGRIHSTFLLTHTSTGRLASQNPNLQNIPARTPEGNRIRAALMGEGANLLASFDYSQIELRLLAHVGHVGGLITAFKNNDDIHRITAAGIFRVKTADVTQELRHKAKAVNFGIIYGQSSFGLSRQLKIAPTEAEDIISNYFRTYPEIRDYIENCKQFARSNGYVETLLGRRCYIPNINSGTFALRQFAERQAVNAVLQGSNADLIKRAMINIAPAIKGSGVKMILQIHDELVFEGEGDALRSISALITEFMANPELAGGDSIRVPLTVNFNIARSLAEAH
ncbi:MAG: DNA polymerase I [Holosporales bacterium]|jgi:DNA polymerase-1|nr:DNA polymerase I [Holosporales bacterium]